MPAENGYVPTPAPIADHAAAVAFGAERPSEPDTPRLLLPGLGTGNLYAGVKRYCTPGEGRWAQRDWDYPLPECVGVEPDPQLVGAFRTRRDPQGDVDVHQTDFLLDPPDGPFDWVLANPPYTRYKRIDEDKRDRYRERFDTAEGQFPLYVPFIEQALDLVKPGGWVTFIIPVKALTLSVTEPLQEFLAHKYLGPIHFLPPQTFDRKVETILISIKDEPSPPMKPEPFWLERVEIYTSAMRELLADLGVDDVDDAKDHYDTMFDSYEQTIRGNDMKATLVRMLEGDGPDGPPRGDGQSSGSEPTQQASLTDGGWSA